MAGYTKINGPPATDVTAPNIISTNLTSGTTTATTLTATTATATTLTATTATATTLTATTVATAAVTSTGDGQSTTIVGYAPTEFATAASGESFYLLKTTGQAAATVLTDTNLLTIPASVTITRVEWTNNGVTIAGGTSINIGTALSSAAVNSDPTTTAVAGGAIATSNNAAGGAVGGRTGAASLPLGGVGQVATLGVLAGLVVPATTATNYVSVTSLAAPNTTGSLRVVIHYISPTP